MPDAPEIESIIKAAEEAAAAGDFAAAEPRLREAATLQEASLGPLHPDLANTLNNLGIVSEILGKPEDAEQFFRRACAIASASLEPSHPLMATSRKNLEEFCNARGIPVDPTAPSVEPVTVEPASVEPKETIKPAAPAAPVIPATPAAPAKAAARAPLPPGAPPARAATHEPPPSSPPRPASRHLVMTVLAAVVLLVIALAIFRRPGDQAPPPAAGLASTPAATPPAASAPPPQAKPSPPQASKPPPRPPVQAPTGRAVALAEARVCRNLVTSGQWRCAPIESSIEPASLFFYTRVKSPTDTTVLHRWYRGDRLVKSAALFVTANPTAGYRTFSRQTVSSGDWRVEATTTDGTLLHEERFTVR